jgi:pSer/pThr/pTyr-binding forkhead associated (FHA) protein/outer membrane protein assembly factor BamB
MDDQDFTGTEMDDESIPEGEDVSGNEGLDIVEKPAPKAKITVKKGEETILEHEIGTLPVKIGRKADNDIVLEERNVSRYHAQIIMKEEQYFLEDLKSTGGTVLNGEPVVEKDIHTGDIIEIGNYQLHFDSGIPEDERTVFEEEATVMEEGTQLDEDRTKFYEEPEAKLIVVKSEGLEGEIVLEEETIIGRDEDADITVDDKRLSRKHCKIALLEDHYVITDLESSNGTFVNGVKISEKVLESGEQIQVGSNVFRFQFEKVGVAARKRSKGVFAKIAIGIACLAVIVAGIYVFFLAPRFEKVQTVMMQKLWEQSTEASVQSSLSLGDLNGDGFINMVAADASGIVYAFDSRQGGLIWNSAFQSGGGSIQGAPLLVDINEKDGEQDVVIGTTRKGVIAIDGGTMRQIWTNRLDITLSSALAAGDINADGTEDVFVVSESGEVLCLDGRQGGLVWKFDIGAPSRVAPVLADLNKDGVSDVIVGSRNYRLYTLDGRNGQKIWVHVGTEEPSTVACADFNQDQIRDIAVIYGSKLVVLEGSRGSELWNWRVPDSALPSTNDPFKADPPAIGDLNGDRILDIILSTSGGHIYAIDGANQGAKYLWDYGLTPSRKTSPSLADLNADGLLDVAIGDTEGNLIFIDGTNGHLISKLNVGGGIVAPPIIGDFTADGYMDVAVGTQNHKIVVVRTQTPVRKGHIAWGSFGADIKNSGSVIQ